MLRKQVEAFQKSKKRRYISDINNESDTNLHQIDDEATGPIDEGLSRLDVDENSPIVYFECGTTQRGRTCIWHEGEQKRKMAM